MSDLLEQAVIEYWGERCPDFDPGCPGCLAWKMVDELASLRSENESLRQKTQYWPDNAERDAVIRHQKGALLALRAYNERLRAALEPLACTCDRANGEACSRAEVNCVFWSARAALEHR